jgi:hypothetical protein
MAIHRVEVVKAYGYLMDKVGFRSRRGGSNSRPTDYESIALPTELLRLEVSSGAILI